ncbi:hypothetical protein HYV89_05505 [Candidatus Woesearchaeota archaeon]|nr:hypothetical protein [Candidatus Woesearchaeota archaeon]
MANQYQDASREVKEAQDFWRIVRKEYELGLNNYFYGRDDRKIEQKFSEVCDEKSTRRRLNLGGK